MATPRKHWFKVPDSIADEDWPDDVLATLIRLQARMNTRWARNGLQGPEAGTIWLTAGDAMSVTRRSSFRRACEVLSRCTRAVTAVLLVERSRVKFSWPKFPEFQGMAARESPETRPRAALSGTQTQTQTQEDPPKPPLQGGALALELNAKAPAKRGRKPTGKTTAPSGLDARIVADLQRWCREHEDPGIRQQEARVPDLAARCLDHFRGEGKLKSDWTATCRNWISRDLEMKRERGAAPAAPPPPVDEETARARLRASAERLTQLQYDREMRRARV